MQAGIFSFSRLSLAQRVFLALAALAVLTRLFVLFTLPDAAITDTFYHLSISKYIIQNAALPFQGIPGTGVERLPVPLFHIIIAAPFMALSMPLSLGAARVFPFIFSAFQLLFSYLILRKLFPRHWPIGFAFAAMQPFLIIFGALNMPDTLASVFVLASFYIWLKFSESREKKYLLAAAIALFGLVFTKENSAILLPVFFIAFLWSARPALKRLWKPLLVFSALILVFGISFLAFLPSEAVQASEYAQPKVFLEPTLLLPLNFNASFWFFLGQGFDSMPFGISHELAFIIFSLVTFPITFFLFFGLAKGAVKKQPHSLILAGFLALASVILLVRSEWSIYSRLLIPVMPLLGIGLSQSFKDFSLEKWKKLFLILFSLTAIYCLAFSSLYALHFHNDHEAHLPLYNFLKELPGEAVVAVHPNKSRAIGFISGKQYLSYTYFQGLGPEETYSKLLELGATHLASTCYKRIWDEGMLQQLSDEGKLKQVYKDDCSTLFEVTRP